MGNSLRSSTNNVESLDQTESLDIAMEPADPIPSVTNEASQVSDYKLVIYHRSAGVDETGKKLAKSLTGHFFLSLEKNGLPKHFGKYSKGSGLTAMFGPEIILSEKEAEIVSTLQKFEKINNEKYLDMKTIKLSEQQYDKASEYIDRRMLESDE